VTLNPQVRLAELDKTPEALAMIERRKRARQPGDQVHEHDDFGGASLDPVLRRAASDLAAEAMHRDMRALLGEAAQLLPRAERDI